MTRPRISVCVSTYNHRRYIADCLLSVLSQDVDADVEVWVGDDMSDDGTSDIIAALVKDWPGQVHHVIHTERQGPIGNLRSTIALADGDFIAHLDGDDFWLPGKLREQLAVLQAAPDCAACCANASVFDDEREPVGIFSNARSQQFDTSGLLRRGNFLNHSSLFYRGGFRAAVLELTPPFIDYRIHLALSAAGGVAYTSKLLVGYRSNSSGSMLVRDNEAVRRQYFEAIEAALPEVSVTIRAKACADFMRRVAFRALRLRRLTMLREWWPEALRGSEETAPRFLIRCLACFLAESARQTLQTLTAFVLRAQTRVLYFR
ncbi:glycosyltransferase [Luteibacter jiangsuensis]|uniref:glycosyltransferase n=1 Tax=Luteibacter jiangsuensis TaxID=637577 RepID=UPI0027D81B6D|nr:glycosyltransferase [Luteibacter jiangsuensis]